MAKTICKILGVVLLLVGIVGLFNRDFAGTHLTILHTVVHLLSGALALYLGFAGTLSGARLFSIVFGIVYALLGLAGFLAGPGSPSPGVPGPASSHHMTVLAGSLELGTMDHLVHILLGVVFLLGGFLTRADLERAVD